MTQRSRPRAGSAVPRPRPPGAALLAALALSACAPMTPAQKGAAIGAVAGSIVGHLVGRGNPLATIGGAAAGGILGHQLANSSDASPGAVAERAGK
jgi:osmotically inducible lipoprotein OsmB